LRRHGVHVPWLAHDLLAELGGEVHPLTWDAQDAMSPAS
jgi:hypothetical protein